jgi:CDP-diacylglycerol pyrophosphatase
MTLLKRRLRIVVAAIAACVTLVPSVLVAVPADPNALWRIVHDLCVPNERERGRPEPCTTVDLRRGEPRGYALLKDRVGATQILLIPTARVVGIESPGLLAPGAPNYFAFAWQARIFVERVLHRALPRTDIALAVNSARGRSQNQLHIHVDCVRPDVRSALRVMSAAIGDAWQPLSLPLAGHRYIGRRLDGAELGDRNPLKLLADGWPAARADMGDQTLVVVGAVFANGDPGFLLLDDHVNAAPGDLASGEELQDHTCAVAKP